MKECGMEEARSEDEREKTLQKYIGIIKLDRPLTLEEILERGEEAHLY